MLRGGRFFVDTVYIIFIHLPVTRSYCVKTNECRIMPSSQLGSEMKVMEQTAHSAVCHSRLAQPQLEMHNHRSYVAGYGGKDFEKRKVLRREWKMQPYHKAKVSGHIPLLGRLP